MGAWAEMLEECQRREIQRPYAGQPAAICVTGISRRTHPTALLSWERVRVPLQATLLLVLAGSLQDFARDSVIRKLGEALYMGGTFDYLMFLQDPVELWGMPRLLALNGGMHEDMLLHPNGEPFGAFIDWLLRKECWKQLLQMENSSGRLFQWVGFGRLDYMWLGNHPPLQALNAAVQRVQSTQADHIVNAVWAPSGEDYGGINDRYILAERHKAEQISHLWDCFSSPSCRTRLLLWGKCHGFQLREASMERLVLLFLRRLSVDLLRFSNVGAVMRPDPSRNGVGHFAYAFEFAVASDYAHHSQPYGATRWAINAVSIPGMGEGNWQLARARSCDKVREELCDSENFFFGGPPEVWDPSWVPKLYSLDHCCSSRFGLSPFLIVVPANNDRRDLSDCVPYFPEEVSSWMQNFADTNNFTVTKDRAQGLELCYQPKALSEVKEVFPTADIKIGAEYFNFNVEVT